LKKKKAICYYRVSSKQQAEKQSIDLQKHSLKEFAEEKSYDIIDGFKDDGISGESIKSRPDFQKTLETIKEGWVDVLLVYMIDRIGRFASRKDRNSVKAAGSANLKNWPNELWAMDEAIKLCDSLLEILDGLKDEVIITQADFDNKEISQLIYQQKRIIFQQYLDSERGIEVWNKGRFEIHLSIPKMANDEFGSKQIKSLKHPSRPALPPARV
jgi:DNA invertase Pin-like site-specific DNA recombinase